MNNTNIIDYKMNNIGVESAMFFPQFNQIYVPKILKKPSILIHEKLHKEYFDNTYGLILKDFYFIITALMDHLIEYLNSYITEISSISFNDTEEFYEKLKNNFSILPLISKIDQELSYNDNIVDIFAFFNKMYEKYDIMIKNTKYVHEGIATYLTLTANEISSEEKNEIFNILEKNTFYKNAYLSICDLQKKWGLHFEYILDIIFKVPLYNYDLIGMKLSEFKKISEYIYNPDKRLEFMLNCSDKEKECICNIIDNRKDIVKELKTRKNRQDIRHKFAVELLDESYMLEIHSIMGIKVPDYKRPFENVYNIMDVVPLKYLSINYILIEHSMMHEQVEEIFRLIGGWKRPLHYAYKPSISRSYFLYGRAQENRMFSDKLLDLFCVKQDTDFISLENINEMIDVNLFYTRTKTVYKKWRKRIMDNQIRIYGNQKELMSLENEFFIRDVILLQSCNSINDEGFHNPEVIEAVSNIIIAISSLGGATGVLVGLSKIIESSKLDISIDLKKKTIDIKNASYKQVIDIFDKVMDEMN